MDLTSDMRDYLVPRTVGILFKGRFSRDDLVNLMRPTVKKAVAALN
jgi:hypothetical protein